MFSEVPIVLQWGLPLTTRHILLDVVPPPSDSACGIRTTQAPRTRPPTPPPTSGAPATNNIVQIAASLPDTFSSLVRAVQAAGLVDTLSSPGPFTVFAPTDAAFASLGLFDVLVQNTARLTSILTFHVVPGALTLSDLYNGRVLTTVNGGRLTVRRTTNSNGRSYVQVLNSDGRGAYLFSQSSLSEVTATNGIIHAINAVLLPVETLQQAVDEAEEVSCGTPSPNLMMSFMPPLVP